MMLNIITLTTDFGPTEYIGTLKGVILGINPTVRIIDVSHQVHSQNVLEGAYVMYSVVSYFPPAIHIGVVDPGVGTNREGLIIQCREGFLVGPDNGLLVPAAKNLGLEKVFRITNKEYFLKQVSDTFHGRDIFAPVATHLSLGVKPQDIGDVYEDYLDLKLEFWEERDGELIGKFLSSDKFGNIISSIPMEVVLEHRKFNDEIEISIKGNGKSITKNMILLPSYGHENTGEFLATFSSSGFLEISVNHGSARAELGLPVISEIRIIL